MFTQSIKNISNIHNEEVEFAKKLKNILMEGFPEIVKAYNIMKEKFSESEKFELTNETFIWHNENKLIINAKRYTFTITIDENEIKSINYTINDGFKPHWLFDEGSSLYGKNAVEYHGSKFDGFVSFHSTPVMSALFYAIDDVMKMEN